jgi:ribosomal protein S6--L-glutamate ligase
MALANGRAWKPEFNYEILTWRTPVFGLKIGIFSRSDSFWATQKIMQAAKERGHDVRYLHTPDVQVTLNDGRGDILYEGRSAKNLDVVIPRIGRSLTQLGILILRQLELLGIPTTLSMRGLMMARNKYLALQALHDADVRFPPSMLIASRVKASAATDVIPPPLVLKLLTGTGGVGVMRVRSVKEAGPIIDTLCELNQLICVQKFVPNPGEDIRAFVVGKRVIAAMKRVAAADEWRSNIHIGGRGVPHKLSNEEEEIAIAAARAVRVEIAGVDMISGEGRPYVIEVNASPGFQGLLAATGVDAAPHIVDYAVRKSKQ